MKALFKGEVPAAAVREALRQAATADDSVLTSVINLGEVFYKTALAAGPDRARACVAAMRELGVEVAPATDARVWRAARL